MKSKKTAPAQGGSANVAPIKATTYSPDTQFLLSRGVEGSKKNSEKSYAGVTRARIEDCVSAPTGLTKQKADAFILTRFRGCDGRNRSRQLACGAFAALVFDIEGGAHSLEEVDSAIARIFGRVAHVIYSTATATATEPRWRVIVWLSYLIPGADYEAAQRAGIELLADNGVVCDKSMMSAAQLSFMPNVPPEARDKAGVPLFYQYRVTDGPLFTLEGSQVAERITQVGGTIPIEGNARDAFAAMRNPNTRMPLAMARELLAYLDPDMQREDWVKIGAALHYEYEGSEEAFQLFDDWSAGRVVR